MGAQLPHPQRGGRSAPPPPGGFMRGRWPLPPLICRRSALHPGDFLVRRKSPKTHQEPPGPWTSGEGGLAPFDPPTLYPSGIVRNNLNPQAFSMAPHLPRHGLTAEGVTPGVAWGEKDRFAHPLKVANRSIFVSETLSRGCGNRRGSEASPSGGSGGLPPDTPLVTFVVKRKSPGVRGGAPA